MEKDTQTELYRLGAQILALESMFFHLLEHLMKSGKVPPDVIKTALIETVESLERVAEMKGGSTVFDIQTTRASEIVHHTLNNLGLT